MYFPTSLRAYCARRFPGETVIATALDLSSWAVWVVTDTGRRERVYFMEFGHEMPNMQADNRAARRRAKPGDVLQAYSAHDAQATAAAYQAMLDAAQGASAQERGDDQNGEGGSGEGEGQSQGEQTEQDRWELAEARFHEALIAGKDSADCDADLGEMRVLMGLSIPHGPHHYYGGNCPENCPEPATVAIKHWNQPKTKLALCREHAELLVKRHTVGWLDADEN